MQSSRNLGEQLARAIGDTAREIETLIRMRATVCLDTLHVVLRFFR